MKLLVTVCNASMVGVSSFNFQVLKLMKARLQSGSLVLFVVRVYLVTLVQRIQIIVQSYADTFARLCSNECRREFAAFWPESNNCASFVNAPARPTRHPH